MIETFDRQPSTLMRPSIEGFLQQLLQQPEFLERVQATLGTALDSTTGSGNVINASSTVYGPQVVRNNGGSTINYTYNPDSSKPKD